MAETGTSLNSTTEGSLEITPTVPLTNYCYSQWYMKERVGFFFIGQNKIICFKVTLKSI